MSARKVLCIYSVLEAFFIGDVDCRLYSSVLNGWLGAAAVSHAMEQLVIIITTAAVKCCVATLKSSPVLQTKCSYHTCELPPFMVIMQNTQHM